MKPGNRGAAAPVDFFALFGSVSAVLGLQGQVELRLAEVRLVLGKADTRYVACADPAERERVRESFLKKKLGLSGDGLDTAIEEVCATMKADQPARLSSGAGAGRVREFSFVLMLLRSGPSSRRCPAAASG